MLYKIIEADNIKEQKLAESTKIKAILPSKILNNNAVLELLSLWVERYPNRLKKSTDQIKEMLMFIRDYRENDLVGSAFKQHPILEEMQTRFMNVMSKISIDHPIISEKEALIHNDIKGPNVADVGCGGNLLSGSILKNNPEVKHVIGVDIEAQSKKAETPFKLMTDPTIIPLADNSYDTVILFFVLHHLDVDIEAYLAEAKRVLRDKGRVLILEDTFSDHLSEQLIRSSIDKENDYQNNLDNDIHELFSRLNTEDKLQALHFIDSFTHIFVNKSREPLVPGKYKTMEDWAVMFKRVGFTIIKEQFLGFSQLGSRNPVSRGYFVLEK